MAHNNIQEIILIGRDASCNFIVEDASVSRNHAQIVNYGNYVSVVDLGSSNGTFVNGKRVTSETTLHPGDELKVGNSIVPWDQLVTPSKGGGKKSWIWIIIVAAVLLLAGLGVGAYFLWIRSDLEKTKKSNDDLYEEVVEGVIKTDSLLDANAQKEQQIQKKENENTDLSKKNSNLKQENADLSNKNSNLQETNSNLKNANSKLSSEKDQAESELEAAKKANEELKRKLDSIEAAKKKIKKIDSTKIANDQAEQERKAEREAHWKKVMASINSKEFSVSEAQAVCKEIGMTKYPDAKNDLKKEWEKAFNNNDEVRMKQIEDAINAKL